jgi:hypothetical protein
MEGGYSTIEPLYHDLFLFHSYKKFRGKRVRTIIFSAQ